MKHLEQEIDAERQELRNILNKDSSKDERTKKLQALELRIFMIFSVIFMPFFHSILGVF